MQDHKNQSKPFERVAMIKMWNATETADIGAAISKPKMQGIKDWIKGKKLETANLCFSFCLFCNKWTQMKRENYSESRGKLDWKRSLFYE